MIRPLIGLILLVLFGIGGQTPPKTDVVKASAVKWQGHFGAYQNGANSGLYCLMASGFFRAPTSPDFSRLVDTWIQKHPAAKVVPIASIGPIDVNNPKAELLYVWVVDDNGPTLNEYLVGEGACPGGTMALHDIGPAKRGSSPPPTPLRIPKKRYQDFLNRVRDAEQKAVQDKRGIWRKASQTTAPK